jgi:hypothetical protein
MLIIVDSGEGRDGGVEGDSELKESEEGRGDLSKGLILIVKRKRENQCVSRRNKCCFFYICAWTFVGKGR